MNNYLAKYKNIAPTGEDEIGRDCTFTLDAGTIKTQIKSTIATYNMLQQQGIEIDWTDLFYIKEENVILGDIKTNMYNLLKQYRGIETQELITAIKNSYLKRN